jgi:DNA-binding beta-propeller fold protein YncE
MKTKPLARYGILLFSLAASVLLGGGGEFLLGTCGPFTDTAADAFCPFILEVFYLGITTGTTPTTYDPAANVTRTQMAAFLSRTVDRTLGRGSRRAALGQYWTTQPSGLMTTTVGTAAGALRSDGADVWVANYGDGTVSRVRGSDGKLLETWTGASLGRGVLAARGQIFVSGADIPGRLYQIDPRQPAGAVTTVASNLGGMPHGITFDGGRIWTANLGSGGPDGSVSIITPGSSIPWTVTTITAGFQSVIGAIFDGANVWVTDYAPGTLLKLDSAGAILQTVTVGTSPRYPVFDGSNIWVPNYVSGTVTVVRASTGAVLQTLSGNGLATAHEASFDGQRILVTNSFANTVSLFKAADLSAAGSLVTGGTPLGVCSDGVSFWMALQTAGVIARF